MFFISATRISHQDSMYCTLSFNCVQVQTVPTAQATPALTAYSSRGYDPYTHSCKARPQTTVGWTSLIVIVIVPVHNTRKVVLETCSPPTRRICENTLGTSVNTYEQGSARVPTDQELPFLNPHAKGKTLLHSGVALCSTCALEISSKLVACRVLFPHSVL